MWISLNENKIYSLIYWIYVAGFYWFYYNSLSFKNNRRSWMSTTKNKNQIDLLKSPVGLTLKRMTIPMTYGMILLMTFNLIDTFFVGLLGTQPLAAISFTFPITFTIISLTIGLGIGTSAVIAKFLGSNDEVSAKNVATSSILLTGILVAFIALLILSCMLNISCSSLSNVLDQSSWPFTVLNITDYVIDMTWHHHFNSIIYDWTQEKGGGGGNDAIMTTRKRFFF